MTDDSSRLRAPGETPGASTAGTPIDTERLRALLAASTPGPWAVSPWDDFLVMPASHIPEALPPGGRGQYGEFTASSMANAGLVAEALTALPALLDEVDRLNGEVDSWMHLHMYLEAAHAFHTVCLDVAKRLEQGGTLAEVVDLVSEYMDEGVGGELTEETIDLLLRAKAAARDTLRTALTGLFDLVVDATDAESYMRDIGAPEIRAAAQALGLPVPEGVPEATPDTEGEG